MVLRILDEDLVRIRGSVRDRWTGQRKQGVMGLCYWGDEIDLVDPAQVTDVDRKTVEVNVYNPYEDVTEIGVINKKKKSGKYVPLRFRNEGDHLLEAIFLDVQQGDAALILTPDRKLMVVDGGEQKFIARYLAATFPHTSADDPLDIDALVITHGDADHFSGLLEIAKAADLAQHRELHARVRAYYHSGLVKGPRSRMVNGERKTVPDKERFGKSKKVDGTVYATQLWDDPRESPNQNEAFIKWGAALDELEVPNETVVRRLAYGDDDAFADFQPVEVQVLGPVVDHVDGDPALPFFQSSASHTINGHSVVLRLRHGNVHFLLGGDLNTHAEERLRHHIEGDPERTLRSEILKVPHHGSHEYEQEFLDQVNPVVSVVSSGDENASKEYVHPRANLMAALGRASRRPMPLVYVTELAAFFAYRNYVQPEQHREVGGVLEDLPNSQQLNRFPAFQRLVFGAVRIRTDGERVLTAVESASTNVKEAYAFTVDAGGNVTAGDYRLI